MHSKDQQVEQQGSAHVVEVIQGQTAGSDARVVSRFEGDSHNAQKANDLWIRVSHCHCTSIQHYI